jgi:hypothetical protein
MIKKLWWLWLILCFVSFFLLLFVDSAKAETDHQIEGGWGLSSSIHSSSWSYEWDYKRLNVFDGYDVSVGYLNEGHLHNHSPDGVFAQFWKGWDLSKFHASIGAGPFFYNDTTTTPVNGVGIILSADFRYEISKGFDAGFKINETVTGKGPDIVTGMPFIVWKFENADVESNFENYKNRILINTYDDNGGLVTGIRYLRDVSDDIFFKSGWILDLSMMDLITRGGDRNGIATEVCVFDPIMKARAGVCTGPYVMSGKTVGIMDIIGIYQVTKHWNLNVDLIRTSNVGAPNGLDVALFGVGYTF